MLFNSIDFALFLPVVFILYWFVTKKDLKYQNLLIVAASYVFYGWWDWRFLSLILFSTVIDYTIGILLSKQNQKKRKLLLWTSILINLGFLGFFKYYNFFVDNFVTAFSFFGSQINTNSLNIILPVGISFYTFQTLSYTIDIYRRKLEPTKDFVAFSAFVSFFPQLVAGPIERASNLLPQFYIKRKFDYHLAVDGMRQILWGLFKKIVIADNAAIIANEIFNNHSDYSGSTLVLGALFFSIQIYGDFSGYSDIAIGTSRLFGFDLKQNFAFPYFSRDIAEFWRRWHISLSTWFRDYVYIPLGGSRVKKSMAIRNTFIIFVVSGFWHGANWTFIIWGFLNALYFIPLLLTGRNRNHIGTVAEGSMLPTISDMIKMSVTFTLVVFSWIFFRAENLQHAIDYISIIFSKSIFTKPYYPGIGHHTLFFFFVVLFFIIEWLGRSGQFGFQTLPQIIKNPIIRNTCYVSLILVIFYYAISSNSKEFIYFQF
jgi:D-alanyl-lipoteichoic acid acyltransferase DltB (MBOAT superfamily)